MIVTIISNFLNHHMLPLCEAFARRGVDVFFVATTATNAEQLKLGYEEMNEKYSFVIPSFKSSSDMKRAFDLTKNSDLVIYCGVWGKWVTIRDKKKSSLRITERYLKGDISIITSLLKRLKYRFLARNDAGVKLLCCGAYAKQDFNFHVYSGNHFRFGYFPKHSDIAVNEVISNKICNSFVWAGRFIDWKRPFFLIQLVKTLSLNTQSIHIFVIGDGPLLDSFKNAVKENGLDRYFEILGALPHESVRDYMIKSQYHLFTSDSNEGWGAVLNESMDCACLPIVNAKIGSSTFLIEDGVNGLVYNDSFSDFLDRTSFALSMDAEERLRMQKQAYATIKVLWNAEVCCDRLLAIANKEVSIFESGPLSSF